MFSHKFWDREREIDICKYYMSNMCLINYVQPQFAMYSFLIYNSASILSDRFWVEKTTVIVNLAANALTEPDSICHFAILNIFKLNRVMISY